MPKRSSSVETIPATEPSAAARLAPPWWVTMLDAISVALIFLLLRAVTGDGVRFVFSEDVRLSFTSWPRLLVWLVVVLGIRHWAWRSDPLWVRVRSWVAGLVRAEPLRAAWGPFLLSRLMVTIVGFIAVATIGFPEARRNILHNPLLDLWTRYDAAWYARIASMGYTTIAPFNPAEQHPIAFFPGLPMAMRTLGPALDLSPWYAGILFVLVAFLAGLAVLYRLAREDLPPDESRASLLFLACYPFATCYNAVLTEAPFLLCATAAFLFLRRERPLAAAPFALYAGFLRPNGFLLSVSLVILIAIPFARSRRWLPGAGGTPAQSWQRFLPTLTVACLPVVGVLVYSAYAQSLTGDPLAWAKAQQAWGRTSAGLLNIASARWDLIVGWGWTWYPRKYPIEIFEAAAALFALGAVWPITRRFGLAYGVFVALAVFPPFFTMGSISLGRYTAPLFPIFLWLGATVPAERRMYWIALFMAGQALVAALFFTGRPPY